MTRRGTSRRRTVVPVTRRMRTISPPRDMLRVSDMTPTKLFPPADPPQVERTIKLSKKVQFSQTVSAGASADFSPAEIMSNVPGGLTYWNSFRIEKILIWGGADADGTITATVSAVSGFSQPPFTLIDSNTAGNRRPAVGFRLGLLDRSRFFGTADDTTLVTVSSSVATIIVVQATIELISPP
jgi:hypothetical protein